MSQFDDANLSGFKYDDLRSQEEERFVASIAPQKGFPYINLRGYTINPEALQLVPEAVAKENDLVCFDIKQKNVYLASRKPESLKIQTVIEDLVKRKYKVYVHICSTQSLEHAWARYKDVVSSKAEKKGIFDLDPEMMLQLIETIKTVEDVPAVLQKINTSNNTRRITETLELIFSAALALRASDIHIEPEDTAVRLRFRFDGVLHDIADLDTYIYERMLSRLKLLSGMILNTKKVAQDGRFTFKTGPREIEIRSSIIPGSIGESIVMRVLDPTVASFSMENLHLNKRIQAAIAREVTKPNGLIITTGPTGSGKTTALYAFLKEAHSDDVKIITIENPVEYKLDGIVQTQVGDDYTFADGLRAILRQDPDIIMVGEVRDKEVAETAIHAAQTGHLVFTTLHTNSAAAGFPRLIDLGIDPRILGASINVILGQRLIRILCTSCKTPYQASTADVALISSVLMNHPDRVTVPSPLTLYKATGCEVCGETGYKGRAAIFEGVIMDEAVEEAVIRDPREHVILEAAKPQGLPTMLEDGIEKVMSGLTSMDELSRVVELPIITTPEEPVVTTPKDDTFLQHVV